jgi:hypothetical protein
LRREIEMNGNDNDEESADRMQELENEKTLLELEILRNKREYEVVKQENEMKLRLERLV